MTTINATRGSDIDLDCTLTDDGGAVDLTGFTIGFIDVSRDLDNRLSGVITNAALGQIRITIEGTNPISVGVYSFRVKLSGVSSIGWPLIQVSIS